MAFMSTLLPLEATRDLPCTRPEAEPEQEMFDVYNEHDWDKCIGQLPRGECHAKGMLLPMSSHGARWSLHSTYSTPDRSSAGIWHKAVYVWVFNPAGELLIQRRRCVPAAA
jgi:hypothetical protein